MVTSQKARVAAAHYSTSRPKGNGVTGSADGVDLVAEALQVGDDLAGVDGVAGLEGEADLDLVQVQVKARAVVLDREHVEAEAGHLGGQGGQVARGVVDDHPQGHVPAGRGQAVVDHLGQQQRVDVP